VKVFELSYRIVEVASTSPHSWEVHEVLNDDARRVVFRGMTEGECYGFIEVLHHGIHDAVLDV
jgi:hypothetical protein